MLHNTRRKSKGENFKAVNIVLRFLLQEMMHPCHLRCRTQMTRKTEILISFLADERGNVEIIGARV